MPQLIISDLEPELVRELTTRAAQHGRSVEAELQEILRQALMPRTTMTLREHLLAMPNVGRDEDFER